MANTKVLSDFKDVLKKEGLKITPQRIAVLEEIIEDKGHRESKMFIWQLKPVKPMYLELRCIAH